MIASNTFCQDGSTSLPSNSLHDNSNEMSLQHHSSTPLDDADVEVPNHVDWRAAYGRRNTSDFGFPGARIKPGSTSRTSRPLRDPGNWIKRSCGHFSYMDSTQSREDARKRLCRACVTKQPPSSQHSAKRQEKRNKVTSESSYSPENVSDTCYYSPRSCKQRSGHSPADWCGGALAKDLENMIDTILEEHTNTLQDVINNMRQSQSSPAQLQSPTKLPIKRHQAGTGLHRLANRPSYPHQTVCQPYQAANKTAYVPVQRMYG